MQLWPSSSSWNLNFLISEIGTLFTLQSCWSIKWDAVARVLEWCVGLITDAVHVGNYGSLGLVGATWVESAFRFWGPTWTKSKSQDCVTLIPRDPRLVRVSALPLCLMDPSGFMVLMRSWPVLACITIFSKQLVRPCSVGLPPVGWMLEQHHAPASTGWLHVPLPNCTFGWSYWEYLHHGFWQTLQVKAPFPFHVPVSQLLNIYQLSPTPLFTVMPSKQSRAPHGKVNFNYLAWQLTPQKDDCGGNPRFFLALARPSYNTSQNRQPSNSSVRSRDSLFSMVERSTLRHRAGHISPWWWEEVDAQTLEIWWSWVWSPSIPISKKLYLSASGEGLDGTEIWSNYGSALICSTAEINWPFTKI